VGQHQSQSHGWGAASVAQLLAYVAGVKVTRPGAAAIVIHPRTAGLLDHVQSRVVTERGPVEVSYAGKGREYTLKINVPANVRATVVLPVMEGGAFAEINGLAGGSVFTQEGQVFDLGSGERTFAFRENNAAER